MGVSEKSVASSGQIRSLIGTFTEKLVARALLWKPNADEIRWLGHVLRTDQARIPKVALRWTPPGKRKPGRP